MSRDMLAAIGGGALSGLLYVGALSGVLGLALVVELPLFLAALALGRRGMLAAGISGAVPVLVAGGPEGLMNYALTTAAPVAVLSRQALLWRAEGPEGEVEWYPPGLLIVWLAGLALALLAVAMLIFSGSEGGLAGAVADPTLRNLMGVYRNADPAQIKALAQTLARIMPGIALSGWMLLTAANGIGAQALLARFGHALRPSPRMESLALPGWLPLVFAASTALALLVDPIGFFGGNAALVLAVPFFFAGLGVVHALVRKSGAGRGALFIFYALTLTFGWPVVFIAALGLIDQWVDFRARWLRDAANRKE